MHSKALICILHAILFPMIPLTILFSKKLLTTYSRFYTVFAPIFGIPPIYLRDIQQATNHSRHYLHTQFSSILLNTPFSIEWYYSLYYLQKNCQPLYFKSYTIFASIFGIPPLYLRDTLRATILSIHPLQSQFYRTPLYTPFSFQWYHYLHHL